ncbi:MAG: hypothetical protein F6K21_32870 [Symploca sp. SIO2D2]|nr:hypothetical protein [Symploca sp. SIO2D2]
MFLSVYITSDLLYKVIMPLLSKEKNQATAGILVVDSNRKIVSLNRKFIELWNLPKHVVVSRDDEQALEFASSQIEKPTSFIKQVRELYWQTKLEIHDIITLKDGRMLERYSQPQWSDTKYAGRVWICREVE